MKMQCPVITLRFMATGLLAVATVVSVPQRIFGAEPPSDPNHAAHVATGLMPTDAAKGDPALSQQLTQLQAKVAQLEAAVAKNSALPSTAVAPEAAAMPSMAPTAAPMTRMSGAEMGAMKPGGGMGGMTVPPDGAMNTMGMMIMMDKMMGMMDKMMSMGGGATPMAGRGMGMGMMQNEMGGMGGTGATPAGPSPAKMSRGGGMGMEKADMSGGNMAAMNSGATGAMPQSMLPGFPGASHLYHIGATGFFLDHPQHIMLTTEQQARLNMAKEHALLEKSTADRAIQQAEQELWTLTAADQPDATAIAAKITEIGKLTGDERLAFIRAVGEASKLLTDQQRQSLAGFAAPASAAPVAAPVPVPVPTAAPMAPNMKGM